MHIANATKFEYMKVFETVAKDIHTQICIIKILKGAIKCLTL